MKTEIVEGWPQGHEIRILISETDASQVNAIRRALIADVPKLAITRVDFSQGVNQDNKGEVVESVNVLPDEVLAHRLAMIPIPTALDEGLVFPNECVNCMDVVEKVEALAGSEGGAPGVRLRIELCGQVGVKHFWGGVGAFKRV